MIKRGALPGKSREKGGRNRTSWARKEKKEEAKLVPKEGRCKEKEANLPIEEKKRSRRNWEGLELFRPSPFISSSGRATNCSWSLQGGKTGKITRS